MIINTQKASYDGRKYQFGEATLEIRPFPMSRQDVALKDGAVVITGEDGKEKFDYCLSGWEGITGADGQPLPCTPEIKEKIYDFRLGIIKDEKGKDICMSDFVILKINELAKEISEAAKN